MPPPLTRSKRKTVSIRSADTKRPIRIAPDERLEIGAAWRQQTLGRLLLFVLSTYEERILEEYRCAGFTEVRQVHLHVTRHIDIATGSRISELAARAGVTKGAMGQLVAECERLGLVLLSPDPADARAKIVELAPRGHELLAVTRRASRRIEAEFAKLIGPGEFGALRSGLMTLRERLTEPS